MAHTNGTGPVLLTRQDVLKDQAGVMSRVAQGEHILVRERNGQIVDLQAVREGGPPMGRKVQPVNVSFTRRREFAGITAEELSSVLSRLKRADSPKDVEAWVDLAAYMLLTDAHLRSVYDTRVLLGAGAEIRVVPGKARPGEETLAEEAADFVRESIEETPDLTGLLAGLHHHVGIGFSAAEHTWHRRHGGWHSHPELIQPRDITFDEHWRLVFRTWQGPVERWVKSADREEQNRFITCTNRFLGDTPNMSGALMSVAWFWFFKRWLLVFMQDGYERFGNPHIIGKVLENATDEARDALYDAIQGLSGDHHGIMEKGTEIEIIEPTSMPGESLNGGISYLDDQVTKGMLGSTLNTDVGSTGGNRALGESQAETTILPRVQRDVATTGSAVQRDWFRPLLEFNSTKWGGRVPAIPALEFVLTQEEPPLVDDLIVNARAVTVDEFREARRLEAWGPEKGGDRPVEIAAPTTAPAFIPQRPAAPQPGLPQSEEAAPVAEQALNGAQIDALKNIISEVAANMLPADAAIELIVQGFPRINREAAERMVSSASDKARTDPVDQDVVAASKEPPVVEAGSPVPLARKGPKRPRKQTSGKKQLTLLPTSPTSSGCRSPFNSVLSES
jgi:phage gp29-like protein